MCFRACLLLGNHWTIISADVVRCCTLLGGKKRSPFYYDIWNIKYLRKFKWDDLVGEMGM
jgi:hypothetical protein